MKGFADAVSGVARTAVILAVMLFVFGVLVLAPMAIVGVVVVVIVVLAWGGPAEAR